MDVNAEPICFITIKNHKENFLNHSKVRLFNPAKNELEQISKTILENVNKKLFQVTKNDQWKNTVRAIKWLISLKDKHLMKFVMFDSRDSYPSITKGLLKKPLNYTNEYINILKCKIDVTYHARK